MNQKKTMDATTSTSSDPYDPSEGTFLSELLMNSKKHLKIRTRPDSARPTHHGSHGHGYHGSHGHPPASNYGSHGHPVSNHADWLHHAIKEFEHDLRHDALFGTSLATLSKEKQMSLAQHLKEKLAELRMDFLEEVSGEAGSDAVEEVEEL